MRRHSHADHVWHFAFIDVLLVLVAVLGGVAALANFDKPIDDNLKPPGNIAVLACWPEGNQDVDLWTGGPGDIGVGYSRKSGKVWALLRDDLGTVGDASPVNCESAFARATPDGSYAINVHGYRLSAPLVVHLEASLNGRLLVSTDVPLRQGQERTVARFRLKDGNLVGDVDNLFVPLREGKK